jgi:hypothetical protein
MTDRVRHVRAHSDFGGAVEAVVAVIMDRRSRWEHRRASPPRGRATSGLDLGGSVSQIQCR